MGVKKVSLVGKSPKVGKRDAAGGISKMGKRNFFAKTHAVSHLTPRGTREKLENQLFSPKIAQNTEIPFPCRWAMCNTLTSHPPFDCSHPFKTINPAAQHHAVGQIPIVSAIAISYSSPSSKPYLSKRDKALGFNQLAKSLASR